MFVSTKSTRGVCNNVVKIMVIAKKIHKNLVSLEPHEFAIFFEKKNCICRFTKCIYILWSHNMNLAHAWISL